MAGKDTGVKEEPLELDLAALVAPHPQEGSRGMMGMGSDSRREPDMRNTR